jgi:hypothetical protein
VIGMAKTRVNIDVVFAILAPWLGRADDDPCLPGYYALDLSDEGVVRSLIRSDIIPEFDKWNETDKVYAEDSLRYMFNFKRDKFQRLFDSGLPPFEPPDIIRFFEIIFEELFPGKSIAVDRKEKFKIVDDVHEFNGVLLRKDRTG